MLLKSLNKSINLILFNCFIFVPFFQMPRTRAQRGRSDPAGPDQAETGPPPDMAPHGGARRKRTGREAPPVDVDIGVNG